MCKKWQNSPKSNNKCNVAKQNVLHMGDGNTAQLRRSTVSSMINWMFDELESCGFIDALCNSIWNWHFCYWKEKMCFHQRKFVPEFDQVNLKEIFSLFQSQSLKCSVAFQVHSDFWLIYWHRLIDPWWRILKNFEIFLNFCESRYWKCSKLVPIPTKFMFFHSVDFSLHLSTARLVHVCFTIDNVSFGKRASKAVYLEKKNQITKLCFSVVKMI